MSDEAKTPEIIPAGAPAMPRVNRDLFYRIADAAQVCVDELRGRYKNMSADEIPKYFTSDMCSFGGGLPMSLESVCGCLQKEIEEYLEYGLNLHFDFSDERADSMDDYRFVYKKITTQLREMHQNMMEYSSILDADLLGKYKSSVMQVQQQAQSVIAYMDRLEPVSGFKATGSDVLDYWRAAASPVAEMPMTDNPVDWGIQPKPKKQDGLTR